MENGESYAKYHPEVCPECGEEYKWINVVDSPRPGEEPDYVFVHQSEIEGEFTRVSEFCRVHEHEANPNLDLGGL